MYGNISFERKPDGEYTQVMLLIQTDTVLELFFEILRSTTANAYLDGVEVDGVLHFILVIDAAGHHSIRIYILHDVLQITAIEFHGTNPLLILGMTGLRFAEGGKGFHVGIIARLMSIVYNGLLCQIAIEEATGLVFVFQRFGALALQGVADGFYSLIGILLFTGQLIEHAGRP